MRSRTHANLLGIVAALPIEGRPLGVSRIAPRSRVQVSDQVVLRLSGIGASAATGSAHQLVSEDGVTALCSWGTAGGLEPGLRVGTIVLPTEVMDGTGASWLTDEIWRAGLTDKLFGRPAITHGSLVQTSELIETVQGKQELFRRTGAVACDMESAAIAMVAREHQVPLLVVRAIVDPATAGMPAAVKHAVDLSGRMTPFRLMTHLAKHPGEVAQLIRLRRQAMAARTALRAVVQCAGPQLCVPQNVRP